MTTDTTEAPSTRELARRTARTLDMLRTTHTNFVAELAKAGILDYVNTVSEGFGRMAVPSHLVLSTLMHRAYHHWSLRPTVYSVHPAMVAELGQMDLAPFPAKVLEHLPHRSPLIVFPDPVPVRDMDGECGWLTAVYVSGVAPDGRRICDTHDPARRGIRLALVTERPGSSNIEVATLHLETTGENVDPQACLDKTAQRCLELDAGRGGMGIGTELHRAALTSKLRPALDTLIYLCSKGMDSSEVPAAEGKRKRGKGQRLKPTPEQTAQVVNVGYRLGPQLADARRRHQSDRDRAGSTGRTVAPHPRRAHYGIRHTGPGRSVPVLTFIRPTFIHADQADGGVPTIVPVS